MPNMSLVGLAMPLLLGELPDTALAAVHGRSERHSASVSAPHITPRPLLVTPELDEARGAPAVLPLAWALNLQNRELREEQGPDGQAEQDAQGEPADPGSEIIVEGEYGPPKSDPIAQINETSYRITQDIDNAVVEPIAYAYRDGLPVPLRDGLGNVVRNIGEPNNALNFLLQGKVGKTFETLGRLLINTTLGVGGLFDVAKRPGIGLPHRRNGFANTMGFYGVGPGPYLYLPLTGATTARDVIGSGLDQLLLPLGVGEPFNRLEFTVPYYIISNLDARLEVDAELERIDATIDPYAARRDSYLYRRAKTIAELKGEEPPEPPAILQEVEGTGDFADDPEHEESRSEGNSAPEPLAAVIVTRPRE